MPAHAQSDGYPYSIMRPEPGSRPVRKQKIPRATVPDASVKKAPKHLARRGSSNPVYPTQLPAPQGFTPPTSQEVVTPPSALPPPIVVPETGRALPNLPTVSGSGRGGAETFQDRAVRCTHQAGVYGPAATGDRNAYVGGCINQ